MGKCYTFNGKKMAENYTAFQKPNLTKVKQGIVFKIISDSFIPFVHLGHEEAVLRSYKNEK